MKFVCALKPTWIRRLMHSNTKWVKNFESELGLRIETKEKRFRLYYQYTQ